MVEELNLTCSHSKNIPELKCVTGRPLKILGAVTLEIPVRVNGDEVIKHLAAVVPNDYLDTDLLLGVDLLNRYPMTWDPNRHTFAWGGVTYSVFHVHRARKRETAVKRVSLPSRQITSSSPQHTPLGQNYLRLNRKIVIPPHHTCVLHVWVAEAPQQLLMLDPVAKHLQNEAPICAQVSNQCLIPLPFHNTGKCPIKIYAGTLLATYTRLEHHQLQHTPSTVNRAKVSNAMLPHSDSTPKTGTRQERLQTLIDQWEWNHLDAEQRSSLNQILLENHDLFILDDKEIGTIQGPPAHIEVNDPTPTRSPLYRCPEKAKAIIEQMLKDMKQKDIIEPSTAAWLSPIVLVSKPDGSKRMCLDYRQVNSKLQADIQPLPRLDELVERSAGFQYYATLDMKDAYWQVVLDEASRDLTTFSDGLSLYRFKRLPFGLSCSPAVFTRQMSNVLAPLARKRWINAYLDDIIVVADSYPQLLERLSTLFERFVQVGIKLNLSKCQIAQRQVKFLGHILSREGCIPDPENVEAVKAMRAPTNVREVRRFLGMAGFYRKHIPGFSKIAVPLTDLTQKHNTFQWTPECEHAFQDLKERLVSAPVLIKADMSKPFILHTDSSSTHVGAALSQPQDDNTLKPVGYFSKKLKKVESRYCVTDQEALAVLLACRHFHHYLWGVRFTIVTDHQPLTSILKKRVKSKRMDRWFLELREYRYDVIYKPGSSNVVADMLSRPVVRLVTWTPEEKWLGLDKEEMRTIQRKERRWSDLMDYLEGGSVPKHRYPRATLEQFVVEDGILYFLLTKKDQSLHYLLVVPLELRRAALELAHDKESGHLGKRKSIDKAESLFYWPNLRGDMSKWVNRCTVCQQHRGTLGLQQPWQELPPVNHPLERISIDLTDMVDGIQGFRYVLTIVDHFSRFVKFYKCRSKTANEVCDKVTDYINDYGPPTLIICDNGGEFNNGSFRSLCATNGIKLGFTTPYNPRGNSVSERLHRTMKSVITRLCKGHPLKWPRYLAETQRVMNTAVHSTLGVQPHYAFFNRHAPRHVGVNLPTIETDGRAEAISVAREVIKETMATNTRKYRAIANRNRKTQSVEKGDKVWVRNETPKPGTSQKLNYRWVGPYEVLEVIREGSAYRLKHAFDHSEIQRAAEKVKPYVGEEIWLVEPEVHVDEDNDDELLSLERFPPRERKQPRRLLEEC